MLRLLHTADWQLGLKLRFLADEHAARLRGERIAVVRDLARIAHTEAVHAVVVAGDVFDDNTVDDHTLESARDALAAFAPVPVFLLPGNHDAATGDGILQRLDAGPHVRALLSADPVDVAGATLHPCPLTQRHERYDPTASVQPCPPDRIDVVVAHGTVLDFDERAGSPNRIDLPALLAKGVDYVALGDWHGLRQVDARAWYAGTPEPTRFAEKDPGHALIVEIDHPGAPPRVTVVDTARTTWIERTWRLDDDDDARAVATWLETLPEKSRTLLRLELVGAVSLEARALLDRAITAASGRLCHLEITDALHAAPTAEDLAVLDADGFVGDAADALRERGDQAGEDALRLLYRWLREVSCA